VGVGFANESSPSYYISFSFPETLDEGDVSEFELQLLQFFSSAFTENLRIKPKSAKLLLIEPMFLSKCIRDCIFRVLVRDLQVLPIASPFFSLLILPTKVLSFSMIPTLPLIAIASAKSSGLIVSIEETDSEVILFSHNRLLMNSLKLSCGYNSCLKEIRRIISRKYSMELDTDTLYNILFTLLASFAQNREKVVLTEFKLQTLEFSEEEILLCVDALLFGSSIHDGYDDVGLVEAIFACINQGNVDDLPLQEKNIIFSGKGSSLPGNIFYFKRNVLGVN
jgi:actin-related protein